MNAAPHALLPFEKKEKLGLWDGALVSAAYQYQLGTVAANRHVMFARCQT